MSELIKVTEDGLIIHSFQDLKDDIDFNLELEKKEYDKVFTEYKGRIETSFLKDGKPHHLYLVHNYLTIYDEEQDLAFEANVEMKDLDKTIKKFLGVWEEGRNF